MSKINDFKNDLAKLINKHGMEITFGNTPDYILADVACDALTSFRHQVEERDRWYGVDVNTISADRIAAEMLLNTPGAIMPNEEGII